MSVRERAAEHPQSIPGVVGGVVITIAIAVLARFLFGIFTGDVTHPVTYLGILGGGFGAIAMAGALYYIDERTLPTVEFWARMLGREEKEHLETVAALEDYTRQGMYLHVVYGSVMGGFYARLYRASLPGLFSCSRPFCGDIFALLPWSLLTGLVFGVIVFLIAMIYVALDVVGIERDVQDVGLFFVLHLVYGLMVGGVSGLWLLVFRPLVFG